MLVAASVGLLAHVATYWATVALTRSQGSCDATLDNAIHVPQGMPRHVKDVAPVVLRNQLATVLLLPVAGWVIHRCRDGGGAYVRGAWDVSPDVQPYAALGLGVIEFVSLTEAYDIVFATLHYTVHKAPAVYKRVHALHHAMAFSLGAGALYTTVTEHLLVNVGSLLIAAALLGPHVAVLAAFVVIGTANTILAHCPETAHALHHRKHACNYGNWPYAWDRSFNTWEPPDGELARRTWGIGRAHV